MQLVFGRKEPFEVSKKIQAGSFLNENFKEESVIRLYPSRSNPDKNVSIYGTRGELVHLCDKIKYMLLTDEEKYISTEVT